MLWVGWFPARAVAWNNSNHCLDLWSPIYYAEVFGLSPIAIGAAPAGVAASASCVQHACVLTGGERAFRFSKLCEVCALSASLFIHVVVAPVCVTSANVRHI